MWHSGGQKKHGGERCPRKPKTTCSFFLRKSQYPVGVVLTLLGEGSALGRLGVGVQAVCRLGIRVQLNIMF